jgi:hypothetical protein
MSKGRRDTPCGRVRGKFMSTLSISLRINVLWRYSSCRNCGRSPLSNKQRSSKIANASRAAGTVLVSSRGRPEKLSIQVHWGAACGELPPRSCRRLALGGCLGCGGRMLRLNGLAGGGLRYCHGSGIYIPRSTSLFVTFLSF